MKDRLRRVAARVHRAGTAPSFATDDVVLGRNVQIGRNVRFASDRVRIGDGVQIRDNVVIEASDVEIGNYATIYHGCFFPGPGTLRIGHNFWLGAGSIVDSKGDTTIGDNVGIGAQSQVWGHMTFGDTLYGCRWDSAKPVIVDDDAWIVGHCLLGPVRVGARSVAMLGSVVTRDMQPDRTYAGSPAKDMTDKFGSQFEVRSIGERLLELSARLDRLLPDAPERSAVRCAIDATFPTLAEDPDLLVLNVESRTYASHEHPLEGRVLRGLLPQAKFTPARASSTA
jgi:acetyltransferase-like isoleucine patch superfamily enzyme